MSGVFAPLLVVPCLSQVAPIISIPLEISPLWMHLGGFMALAGEMTALISHVRLRVSPPLLVVPCISRPGWPQLLAFYLKMIFDNVLMLQC